MALAHVAASASAVVARVLSMHSRKLGQAEARGGQAACKVSNDGTKRRYEAARHCVGAAGVGCWLVGGGRCVYLTEDAMESALSKAHRVARSKLQLLSSMQGPVGERTAGLSVKLELASAPKAA